MDFGKIVEPIKAHPFILIGGVAAVLLYWQLKGSGKSAPAPTANAYVNAADPALLALDAQKASLSAQTAQASIAAQTQQSYTQAMAQIGMASISEKGHEADLAAANAGKTIAAANAATGASIFATAVAGLTQNYFVQLAANGAAGSKSSTSSFTGSGAGAGAGGTQSGSTSSTSVTSSNNPAGSAIINTANSQIEQLFNNILRAGQGMGPLEQTIMTDGGGSTPAAPVVTPHIAPGTKPPETGNDWAFTHHDPLFLNWVDGHLQSITDVTPGAKTPYGYSGSYTDIATGQTKFMGPGTGAIQ